MSINLSQNKEYLNQNNFGAGGFATPEATAQADMLKSMDLPSTPDEFVKFAPYAAGAFGLSKLLEKAVTSLNRVNPLKNPNATLEESFQNSSMAKLSRKIDNAVLPVINKFTPQINATKSAFQKYTPNWIKNIVEKVKIGVEPKCAMAKSQYRGLTHQSADYFMDLLKKLPPQKLQQLGVDNIVNMSKSGQIMPIPAVEAIAKKLAKVPVKDLQGIPLPKSTGLFSFLSPKKLNLVDELNKSRSFIASNAKTPITKALQKGTMSTAEAASGGMIGGLFGVIMNSIFLASAIKRTWNAPWGEKTSTFMEAALGDFLGGYLMMFLSSKITYKLLGLKNVDKSVGQLNAIKNLTQKITTDQNNYKLLQNMIKAGRVDMNAVKALGINPVNIKSGADLLKAVSSKAGAINTSIDQLAKMKAFQGKNMGFFKKLLYKPLTMIGNFFSVGLESLPAKIADGKNVSALKAGFMKLKNFLKGAAGFPVRFFLVLMIIQPIFQKLLVKFSHKTFGKPTNSVYADMYKDKEKNENNAQKVNMNDFANLTKLTGMARMQSQGINPQQPIQNQVAGQISPNLINQTLINQQKRLTEPQVVQQTVQKASPSDISPATYVPNTTPTSFTDPSLIAEVNKQLEQSNSVEKYINRELNSLKSGNAYEF